ncbi:MAG TPA: hypothetical protein VJB63_01650 [Patescibacteria group bacterium]|nr:hypothetical protein [Patescibacteria group bacterium]
MLNIFLYTVAIIAILYILGYGLTLLILPSSLRQYSFWLIPWVAIIFLIFTLVIFSLAGMSVFVVSPVLIGLLLFLDVFVIFKTSLKFVISFKEVLYIGFLMLMVFTVASYPLLRHEKYLTTISLGNNDPAIYALTGDYLVNHSINEFFRTNQVSLKERYLGVGNLIAGGYRWGSPMLLSFFLSVLNLKGYQLEYLLQAILFVLCLPLLHVLIKLIYKPSTIVMVFAFILFGFNANLLYMVYHNFFGQVLFWGIELFLIIGFFSYFFSDDEKNKYINKHDIIISIAFAVLYFSYHESIFFVLVPLGILLIFRFLLQKQYAAYWRVLIKIGLTVFLISSVSVINQVVVDMPQVTFTKAVIGWNLFRKELPYANPFEMMGFYSIHSFEPLPVFTALVVSMAVIAVIILGLHVSKKKLITVSFMIVYILFYIWLSIVNQNFFAFNRVVTYTLPLLLMLFAVGMGEILRRKKQFFFIIFILIGLEIFFGLALMRRFVRERITVDTSFISLEEIKKQNIQEPIYMQSIIIGSQNYWSKIWTDYFLNSDYKIYSADNFSRLEKFIPDSSLILISKYSLYSKPAMILAKNTTWENEYYKLVRACDSDECLLESKVSLHFIDFKTGEHQDSLFISGWSVREDEHRWINAKSATMRLVARKNSVTTLHIQTVTLKKPQTMTVYVNEKKISEQSIDTQWDEYIFTIGTYKNEVLNIKLVFDHLYNPKTLGLSFDDRDLAVDVRKISLE